MSACYCLMSNCDAVHVYGLRLWAHVGVLEVERVAGQWFSLDFSLQLDLSVVARDDNLCETSDYSIAVQKLQQLASELCCFTLEHFSELILDQLECIYGSIPMHVLLRKCAAPMPGFDGTVAVERYRSWPKNH